MPADQSNSHGRRDPRAPAAGRRSRLTGLLVPFDPTEPHGAGPIHSRLAAALRARMNDGSLRPGDRLPASRTLAEDLGLSRWVVTEAYDQLKAEGYLTGRVGSGTLVASGVRGLGRAGPGAGEGPGSLPPLNDAVRGPVAPDPSPALDLSPALPDLASFPRQLWRVGVGWALATASDADLGHPDPAGAPALRVTVADYLGRVRGLQAGPERVHVTLGVRNAVSLVCRALRGEGAHRVAVEDPCWPRLREVAHSSGLAVVPVGVDTYGMRVDELDRLDVDAVFVTPTHQFPTGVPMSARRRVALTGWAAARGAVVVEDDYDAEFRYDRRPVGALAGLAPEHVVYLGSTSKTLSPGLHLGWMVAPPRLAGPLARARAAVGAVPPTLDQFALVHLLTSGGYDRHLRRMRRSYQRRRAALIGALGTAVPGHPAAGMDAGLHVLWLLPAGVREPAVLGAARDRGLVLLGLSQCRVAPGPPGLVIGYGNVPAHRADAVAAAIADAVAHAGRRAPG